MATFESTFPLSAGDMRRNLSGAQASDSSRASACVKAPLHASALRGLDTRGRSRDWLISERRTVCSPRRYSADMCAKTHPRMHDDRVWTEAALEELEEPAALMVGGSGHQRTLPSSVRTACARRRRDQSILVAISRRSMPVGCLMSPNSNVTDSIVPVKRNRPFFS